MASVERESFIGLRARRLRGCEGACRNALLGLRSMDDMPVVDRPGAQPRPDRREHGRCAQHEREYDASAKPPSRRVDSPSRISPPAIGMPVRKPTASAATCMASSLRGLGRRWRRRRRDGGLEVRVDGVVAAVRDVDDHRVRPAEEQRPEPARRLVVEHPLPPVARDVLGNDDERDRARACPAAMRGRARRGRPSAARRGRGTGDSTMTSGTPGTWRSQRSRMPRRPARVLADEDRADVRRDRAARR